MTKTKMYRYYGEGGAVDTKILLPMEHDDMWQLKADVGKVLTDGETVAEVINIPVADLEKWSEIDKPELSEEGEAE